MKQTILITGASTGIGKSTAQLFAAKGWNVAATMRNPEGTTDLNETENLKKFKLDVEDKKGMETAVADIIKTFGKIDVVLNNAGYGTVGVLEAASEDQIRRQFEVNFFGVIDVIKTVLPHFRANKKGLFINVSSIGGLVTFPMFSLYHASKWALEGLTESLQYEMNPLGIQLKMIEPGGVKTDFAGRSLDMFDSSKFEDYNPTVQRMMKNYGLDGERRSNYAEPEVIANVIFEAATDGKTQFRYVCGNDAIAVWQARQQMPYEDFREMIKTRMLG